MDARDLPQPMRPHGFVGRIFGVVMEWLSAPNYRWVVAQLAPIEPQSYLEIGFGTGQLMRLAARKLEPRRIAGVDPSPLMVATARRKLRGFGRKIDIALQEGDDRALAHLDGPFDAVVASHSFQFWSDPAATLARIRALLSPKGRLVLVLRKHISGNVMAWIANLITKTGDERGGTRAALARAGLRLIADETLKTGSYGLVAEKAS